MAQITIEVALSFLNAGGWRIQGGRLAKAIAPTCALVTEAQVVGDAFVVRNGSEAIAAVNIDRLTIEMTDWNLPRRIAFSGPFMVKQQRKKVDGGGYYEAEQIGTQLLLVNAAAQAKYEADLAEKRRADEQAKREADRLAREQAAAEWARHLAEYVARQKTRLQGAQFEDFCFHGDSVTVKFSGGIELTVELHDREDPHDVHTNASLGIVIGGEHL